MDCTSELFAQILKDFKSVGDQYSGYMDGAKEYRIFLKAIGFLGYSFAVRTSRILEDIDSSRIVYSMVQGDLQIPFLGSPFQVTKTYDMQCSQGPSYKRQWTDTSQYMKTFHPLRKTRKRQPTQRIGCPCKLAVKCIRLFTGYKVNELKRGGTKQYMLMKLLKCDLKDPCKEVETQERYYVSISKESLHTHPFATDAAFEEQKKRGKRRVEGDSNSEESSLEKRIKLDVQILEDSSTDKTDDKKTPGKERASLQTSQGEEKDVKEERCFAEGSVVETPPPDTVPSGTERDPDVGLRRAQNVFRERLHILLNVSDGLHDVGAIDDAVKSLNLMIASLVCGADTNPGLDASSAFPEAQQDAGRRSPALGQTETQLPWCQTTTTTERSIVHFEEMMNAWQKVTECKKDGTSELNLKHSHSSACMD